MKYASHLVTDKGKSKRVGLLDMSQKKCTCQNVTVYFKNL